MNDIQQIGVEQDYYTLEFRLTTKCNYNCYYCTCDGSIGLPGHNNKNKIKTFNIQNVLKLIESIKDNIKKPLYIFIYGGEPTLNQQLEEIITAIADTTENNDIIEVLTNMYKSIDWWKRVAPKIKDKNIRISGSYHNTQSNLPVFLNKCVFLKSQNLLGMITVMFNKKMDVIDSLKRLIAILGEEHVELSPLTEFNHLESSREIDFINENIGFDKLKKYGHFFQENIPYSTTKLTKTTSRAEMWLKNINKFYGYKCNVTIDKFSIDWDGNCYTGCCNDLYSKKPPVFNINDPEVNYDTYFKNIKCTICPYEKCLYDLEHLKVKTDQCPPVVKINPGYNNRK